nr:MAG TPA: Flagellin, PadR, transcription factor, DNA.8A [Caudoviricetes sp.]
MKLDLDLIRELLITIENASDGQQNFEVDDIYTLNPQTFDLYGGLDAVEYHLRQLALGGYIVTTSGYDTRRGNGVILDLTWEGHEFIRNISNPSVWRKIKDKLSPVTNNVSLSVLGQVAGTIVKQQLGIG